jgi:hypothetical protein
MVYAKSQGQYIQKLKQNKIQKFIEAKDHQEITGKIQQIVREKLNLMNSVELAQCHVAEWVETVIHANR